MNSINNLGLIPQNHESLFGLFSLTSCVLHLAYRSFYLLHCEVDLLCLETEN